MGNPVLLYILILSLSLFYKLENAKGRSLLVLTSAPVSLHSALSSASLLDDPLARANAPTKSQNLTGKSFKPFFSLKFEEYIYTQK
jgi:hypothetical protein